MMWGKEEEEIVAKYQKDKAEGKVKGVVLIAREEEVTKK